MKIYRYIPNSDDFDSVLFREEDREKRNLLISGRPCKDNWKAITLEEYSVGKTGDFPSLYRSIPCFSEKAVEILKAELKVEIEPLTIESSTNFKVINLLAIYDVLKQDESELTRNRVTGKVSSIQKYIFDVESIKGLHMFKIPETSGLEIYISDTFKQVVEDNGLKGLSFREPIFES